MGLFAFLIRLTFLAVPASPISDVERHHNSISFLQKSHTLPDLLDYAHILMPKDDALSKMSACVRELLYRGH